MPVQAHREAQVSPEAFRQQISAARRQTGRLQKELAEALGLNPHVLSHKLHGTDGARLTHPEVKQIIKTLASWEAIMTQDEAIELLALMGLKPESFSAEEWATAPLNQLEQPTCVAAETTSAMRPPHAPGQVRSLIPAPLTPLIGREGLVTLVCDRVRQSEVRLLTLLGPGGVGKTRLSLEVARQLRGDFADGVYVVTLAAIRDPALVPSAIAQVLALTEATPEHTSRISADLVRIYLAGKSVLLVLDNLEHLLAAAPFIADLLTTAPALKVLVTSRVVLHLFGEHVIGVPPLAFPDPHHLPEPAVLAQSPAIRLFLERAQAVDARFALTEQNMPAVAQICAHLDGLPLAIELAAARMQLFSPQALLMRLAQRFQVLTHGPRDMSQRQQSLRNTLAWSYDLLTAREQRLFRRLAVFVGGCTLEAIESVCQALGEDRGIVFEEVTSLLDKSLIYQGAAGESEPRLMMLETIHEYALELLTEQGESEVTRRAHAAYYLALAEEAQSHLRGAEQRRWLTCLEREHENLRAALEWLLEHAEARAGTTQAEQALRLGIALYWFWYLHGDVGEGQAFLERALDAHVGSVTVRGQALYAAGELAFYLDDYARVEAHCRESLALFQELGDARGMAEALYLLGTKAWAKSDFAAARAQLEEALALYQQLGDTWGSANTLIRLGRVCLDQGALARARGLCEQSLTLFRELGDQQRIAYVLAFLARVYFVAQIDTDQAQALAEESLTLLRKLGNRQMSTHVGSFLAEMLVEQGEAAQARALAEESVAIHRESADKGATAQSLFCLARVVAYQGDLAPAQHLYKESLACAREIDYQPIIVASLEGLGEVAVAQGEVAWAARLWGLAQRLRQAMGAVMFPAYRTAYERAVATARAQLGQQPFAEAQAQGWSMSLDQVLTAHVTTTMPSLMTADPEPPSSRP